MRKSIIAVAALSALTWSTVAWAVLDTSVTITNEGQPVPGATISVSTSEGPTPKPVKKSDSSGKVPVRYDEKKVKPRRTRVHLTVRARVPTREGTTREVTRDVDVSMETLISGQLVIDLVSGAPPGAPPVTNAPGDWPGTYVGGGAGGRWTQCPDFTTAALSTGGRWAVLDLKVPGSTPTWLIRLSTGLVRPHASIDDWIMRRPWDAIRAAMQHELTDLSWTELTFGTAFLAAGSRTLTPAR